MLRKSLSALALAGLLAAPALAQEETHQWSQDRPDAYAPAGIIADRLIPLGSFEFEYRYSSMDYGEVRLGTDDLDFFEVLDFYEGAPFGRTDRAHTLIATFGLLPWVTLQGSVAWMDRQRDVADEDVFVSSNASGLSDIEATALIELWDKDNIRAHLIGGVEIPTGSIEKAGATLRSPSDLLPYEMQLGTGSISIVPGASAAIQNDRATVGAQVKARIRLYDNSRDYRLGDEFAGALWMNFLVNDYFAVTSGLRVLRQGSITGQDPALIPEEDPGADPFFSASTRVDFPVGLNIQMREGLLQNTVTSVEFVFPGYQNFDAPRMTGDWGFNVSIQRPVTFFGIGRPESN